MNEPIKIPLGKNYKLVVQALERTEDYPSEAVIYIENNNDVIIQDIAVVRPEHPYPTDNENAAECLVWTDKDSEDYTHRFTIELLKDNE